MTLLAPLLAPLLTGRAAELAALDSCLAAASGGQPQVVLVEGEPGMGKSALMEAFLRRHPEATVLGRVRCDRFEQQLAFGVAGLLLERWLTETSEVQVARELLSWLGDAQSDHHAVIVVAIDDAQWLDRGSAQALRLALRRLRADAVLTLVARRPLDQPEEWQDLSRSAPGSTVLRLLPLTPGEVRELAAAWRGWSVTHLEAEGLVQRTGGLPLLVEAVLGAASCVDELSADGTDVPASASVAAGRMLASIDLPARQLVEAAAVLAEPTGLVPLGLVAQVDDPAVASGVARGAGLLRVDGGGRLECAHALLRDAIYPTIPPGRRRQLHARAAGCTTHDRRLAHLVAAADHPDPALVEELVRSADSAAAGGQHALAAEQRLLARSVSVVSEQRDALLLDALMDRVAAQDLVGAETLAAEADRIAPGPLRSLALGLLAREVGAIPEARSLLDAARAQTSVPGSDLELAAKVGVAAAGLHVVFGEGEAAMTAASTALASSDPSVAGDAATLRGLGQWQHGDLHGALHSLGAVETTRAGRPWEVGLLAARGMVKTYAGELDSALVDLDAALSLTHLWRRGSNQPRTYMQRSMTRYHLGDWDGAAIDASAARAIADGLAQPWSVPLAEAVSAIVPASRGQRDVVEDHLARARAGMAKAPSLQVSTLIQGAELRLAASLEDYDAVLSALAPLRWGDALHQLVLVRAFRGVFTSWVQACVEVGRLAEAEQSLAQYEDLLRRWPSGPVPAGVGLLKGRLAEARGDAELARQSYADDLADPELARRPFLKAQLLQVTGRLERSLGNRRHAIDHLRDAQQIFASLRAAPWLDRCTADLAACGLRGDPADMLALTNREEDVVALVVRGLTNREVGAELFLTAKTVEYHLGNVYTKLGIRSRRELRQLRA